MEITKYLANKMVAFHTVEKASFQSDVQSFQPPITSISQRQQHDSVYESDCPVTQLPHPCRRAANTRRSTFLSSSGQDSSTTSTKKCQQAIHFILLLVIILQGEGYLIVFT